MRVRRVVAGAFAVLLGLAVPATAAKPRPPAPYYFHSASGGYQADWRADRAAATSGRAPAGSALSTSAPRGSTVAQAVSTSPRFPGMPTEATFALPVSGPLTSVCVDVWVSSHFGVPTSPVLYVYLGIAPPGLSPANDPQETRLIQPTDHVTSPATYTQGTVIRLTKLLLFPPHTVAPKGSSFIIGANSALNNPDWTLYYDAVSRPSSVTFNARGCTARPVPGSR
jgi:hypothetical protein